MKPLRQHIVEAAKEYFSINEEEIEKRIKQCMNKVNKSWYSKKDIISFYELDEQTIYGLIDFNDDERVYTILYPIGAIQNKEILDFGGGIGELGMCLSKNNTVYYYDIGVQNEKFAKLLSERTRRPIVFLDKEKTFSKTYDVIMITDVLEHMEQPLEVMKELTKMLNKNGMFLTTGLDFAVGPNHPSHLENNLLLKNEFNTFMNNNFSLRFFHATKNEIIYLWVKK